MGASVAINGTAGAPEGRAPVARFRWIDPRYLQAGLATTILVLGQYLFQMIGGYDRLAAALVTAVVLELLLCKLYRGFWPNVISAYISGVSIVILTKPTNILWPFFLGSAISILSKYVITWKGRHLFNPTNFGICVLLMVAANQIGILGKEWGNSLWALGIVWAWGFFVVWRARVIHLTLTYLGLFIALAWFRTTVTGNSFESEIAPLTGPMQTLFMFFMITDPSVVMSRMSHRIVSIVAIALLECVFRLQPFLRIPHMDFVLYAPSMFSLFFLGAPARWLDLQFLGGDKAPRRLAPRGA